MISIVMHGRNDAHGYNLHKRAAISLNTLASILTEPDDEIIFVDYCTESNFPTFPEAIYDLLTHGAKQRLRILRVPAHVHRRYASIGSTTIIDVVARNIGLRRTNPSNRWVLSTTSDIVVVPRASGESFSSICRGLPDGFYGLARFGVPELLWESVDRLDPESVKSSFATWGARFHLHEIILSDPQAVFDSCGDFQLALRDDLFAIKGFDERMVAGWQHSDSNLQKRLMLHRNGIQDFSRFAFVYHTDHQRQATATHSVDRIENDWDLFVVTQTDPNLPFQEADWGCPDVDIPELRLAPGRQQSLAGALDVTLLDPPRSEPFTVTRDDGTFDRASVPVTHVFPFLADHVVNLTADAEVCYVGRDIRLLRALAGFRAGLGFAKPILVMPAPFAASGGLADVPASPFLRLLERNEAPPDATLMIFDFSIDVSERVAARIAELPSSEGLEATKDIFLEETARESARLRDDPNAEPRRYVVVNAIHTSVEGLVDACIVATRTTYGTRIRHGYVPRPSAAKRLTTPAAKADIESALGHAISAADLSLALSVMASCRRGQSAESIPRWTSTPTLMALLDNERLVETTGVDSATAQRLRQHLKLDDPVFDLTVLARCEREPDRLVSRLCDFDDWDDARWAETAARCTGESGRPYHKRHRSEWERIQMIHLAEGLRTSDGPVAMISVDPDDLLGVLTRVCDEVDVFSLEAVNPGESRSWLRSVKQSDRGRVSVDLHGLSGTPGRRKYRSIFVPGNAVFHHETVFFDRIIRFAESMLDTDGLLIFSADFVVGAKGPFRRWGAPGDGHFPYLEQALAACSSLRLIGPFQAFTSPCTLVRQATVAESRAGLPHALIIEDGKIRISGIWGCRRCRSGAYVPDRANGSVAAEMTLYRNLLPLMSLTPLSSWENGLVRSYGKRGEGHLLSGPSLPLPSGDLAVSVFAEATEPPPDAKLVLELLRNGVPEAKQEWEMGSAHGERPFSMPFRNAGGENDAFEFRLTSHGDCQVTLSKITVSRVSARRSWSRKSLLERLRFRLRRSRRPT